MRTCLFILARATVVACVSGLYARSSHAQVPDGYRAEMSLASAEKAMKEQSGQIADHVYLIRAPLGYGPVPLANEVLIEQSDGLVLVDAGKTRGAGARIVALIRQVSRKPVKAVILTHWHQDHVLGLGPIVEAWPKAAIIANTVTRDALLNEDSYRTTPRNRDSTRTHDSTRAAALRRYAVEYGPHLHDATLSPEERRGWADVVGVLNLRIADEKGTYLVLPTVAFTDRYRIDDVQAPVEAITLGPSHTNGDVAVWMPKQRVAAAGDVVVAPIPYTGSHVVEWPATLANLEQLRPRLIVPGHGPLQTDLAYVDRMIAGLTELQIKVQPLVAAPPIEEDSVPSRIDLSNTRRQFAGTDRWLAYWFDQYFAPNAGVAYTQLRTLRAK